MDLTSLRYAKSHEWARLDGDTCTVGITKFAVEQLTDVTYLKLPGVGAAVKADAPFGEVESVKAVSDLYSPVDGVVTAVNQKAADDPSLLTRDSYDEGWLIKVKVAPGTTLSNLMTLDQYEQQIASEGH
jgi:glycine cleavage system H protein